MEYWNNGVVEYWNNGMVEWWNGGFRVQRSGFRVGNLSTSNIERPTSNVEWKKMQKQIYEMIL